MLDPIAIQTNGYVGRALSNDVKENSDAVYTRFFDGITEILLFHHTTTKMNNKDAQEYCSSLGLGLPTLRTPMDLARIAPFVTLAGDFWMFGIQIQSYFVCSLKDFKSHRWFR